MKALKKFVTSLAVICGLMLTGCNKEKPTPKPEPEIHSVSFTEAVEAFSELGIEVVVPDYVSESEELASTISGTTYYLTGTTHAEMETFAGTLIAAGWGLSADSFGDYSGVYGETKAKVYVADYLEYSYQAIVVSFSLAPDSSFPSEEIAEDLSALGVTDTLPAFTGEQASAFSWYCEDDGIQLMITVAEGSTEAAVIAQYQADLLSATYVEAGVDTYGDMHYTSPSGELDVVAWAGSDIGYTGYVFVDIEVLID